MASVLSRRYRFSLRDVIMGRAPIERAIIPSCLHCLKVLPSPVNASLDDRMHLDRLDVPDSCATHWHASGTITGTF